MRTPARLSSLSLVLAAALAVGGALLSLPGGSTQAADGPHESIKVRGHWVLEVRGPDGTTVERREVHNAFVGAGIVSQILTSRQSPGAWELRLESTTDLCPAPFGCRITEARNTTVNAGPSVFKNLTTAVLGSSGFELRGFIVASQPGPILGVSSHLAYCVPTVTPAACVGTSRTGFTGATIQPAVSLLTGQQLLVTLTINFSSTTPQ